MVRVFPGKLALLLGRLAAHCSCGWQVLCAMAVVLAFASGVSASPSGNRLCRFEAKSKPQYTRLVLVFESQPRYQVSHLENGLVQITFQETTGTSLKKHQGFVDARVAGITITDLGNRLRLRFVCRESHGTLRVVSFGAPNVVAIDIGTALRVDGEAAMPAGREQIWQGSAKLIREFDPPLTAALPFFPMPGFILKKLLTPDDLKVFLRGEAALFRERGTEAEELFADLVNRVPAARPFAAYRLGEAQYLLQKYASAVNWFREGERLAPQLLVQSPSIVFAYADSLARCGESEAGRKILDKIIVSMADTPHGPVLLVRLADLLKRGGRANDAFAVYRSVADNFPGSRAALFASTRLADRRLFQVSGSSFSALADEYRQIFQKTSEPNLKEEALFKRALLNALYGSPSEGVAALAEYGATFPRGIFFNVAKSMREDLLLLLYRQLAQAGNCQALVRIVRDHRPYLSRCMGESTFIPQISSCFAQLGMVREELDLLSAFAETAWAGQNREFIYQRIVAVAWELEDFALVAVAAKTYLKAYPGHDGASLVRERLAWILYRNRDLLGVYGTLLPLMSGKGPVREPQSFYFFGKASEAVGDKGKAEQALSRYLAALPTGSGSALAADARLMLAASMQSRKATAAALAVLQAGFEASQGERRDMFLFKLGELLLASGKTDEAAARWQQLIRDGTSPLWKTMAYHSLNDLQWRRSIKTPDTSK